MAGLSGPFSRRVGSSSQHARFPPALDMVSDLFWLWMEDLEELPVVGLLVGGACVHTHTYLELGGPQHCP